MRILASLTLLVIALCSFGQTKTKSNEHKLTINKDLVTQIDITNHCYPLDSCQMFTYNLSDSMIEDLIDRLNKSHSMGPCKYINLYVINIYLTDGTKRMFRINGPSIKENSDWCFDIKDPDYAQNVWAELNRK